MNLATEENVEPFLTEEGAPRTELEQVWAVDRNFAESLARTYAERTPPEQFGTLHRV